MLRTFQVVLLLVVSVSGFELKAQSGAPDCPNANTPIGALPPAIPIWCQVRGEEGPATFVSTSNSWLDDFQHGLSNAGLGDGYVAFSLGETNLSQQFRHADHWMQDIDMSRKGGVTMRPDRSFRFEGGRLVIEADFAAAIADYGSDPWGELTVTTATQPTGSRRDALYAYDYFPNHYTLGCRLQPDRIVTCSLMDNTDGEGVNSSRVWEMSFFQIVGTESFGGGPWGEGDAAWRVCTSTDPDIIVGIGFGWN